MPLFQAFLNSSLLVTYQHFHQRIKNYETIQLTLLLNLSLIAIRSLFFSFSAQSPADYTQKTPELYLKKHLSGAIQSEGLIYGPTGKVTNCFVTKMFAQWDGDTGTMIKDFSVN
tara:strand:- start:28239 stop:28580 length:342 start_codon:yes stop_codon:yes gene_type:complete